MIGVQKLLTTTKGRDSLLLLLARLIQMANGFMLSILLLRLYGLDKVGSYTVAVIAVAALSQLCSAGLHYSLPREHLSNQECNSVALWWAVYLAAPVCFLVPVYGVVMARLPGEWPVITLFAWGGYFLGQANVLNTLLLLDNKTRWSVLPPVVNAVGMLAAALMTDTLIAFAAALLISRALGNASLFLQFDYARVSPSDAWRYGLQGLKYTPIDLVAMLSEQIGPLIMAYSLTRAELGLFGLCQQLLSAADTPGWSVSQAHYPALAKSEQGIVQSLRRSLVMLSVVMAVLLCVGSFVLGEYVYKAPLFFPMMALLAVSMPWRYLNNFYDQVLRAAGWVRMALGLAILKLLLAGLFLVPLVLFFGVWGAVTGLVFLSVISSLLYGRKAAYLVWV